MMIDLKQKSRLSKYYQKTRSERLAYARNYYCRNREAILEREGKLFNRFETDYVETLRKFLDSESIWFHRDPRERALMRRATPGWIDWNSIREFYKICVSYNDQHPGIEYHLVHIVPIRGYRVCGLHVPWNLRIASRSYMMAKRFDRELAAADHLKWLRERGL